LADPARLRGDIDITGEDRDWLVAALRRMALIRRIEETIAELVRDRLALCPCHLAVGQEAVAVGVARHVKPGDRVFGAHRSHAHFIALGGSPFEVLAEVLGREPGCSRGMGGSMHLVNPEIGFYGSVPIVAATIPIATGAALAAKLDGGDAVAVSFFGDGATEEGVFHESMNLAAAMRLPVVFVCENNLFSSHLHISLRQPSDRLARFAAAHCMPGWTVDGNDVVAVASACREAFAHARGGNGPAFVEAVTYRWRGHVGHREDIDVGVKRTEDLEAWKQRDPIRRLADALAAAGIIDGDSAAREVAVEVADALRAAQDAPFPPASALRDLVYAGGPA
jgi:pyruvate dehydrogenase E1 component alpha subunit